MDEFLNYLILGISTGFVYSLIGMGFAILYKCSGVLNIAQGEVVIISAYIFYFISTQLGAPVAVAFVGTFLLAIILGLVIERAAMRPLIGQPLLTMVIVTLAIASLLRGLILWGWHGRTLSLPQFLPHGGVSVAGALISYEYIFFIICSIVIFTLLTFFFKYTRTGLAMLAVAESHHIAQSMGISVKRIIAISWALTCFTAAVGGILLTSISGVTIECTEIGLKSIAVVLLGGLESISGVMIAGPVVGIIEYVAAGYLDPLVGGGFRGVAPFVVLVIVIIFRPYGLFGLKKIERV